MSSFIKSPNLPKGEVKSVAISSEAEKAISKLNQLGIKTIEINKSAYLPAGIDSHADLQILHLEDNRFLTATEHLCTGESKKKINIERLRGNLGKKYPFDVPLNCVFIGNKLICNTNTVALQVLEFAEESGFQVIHVNQGYTRCSTAVINKDAIITDDITIFTAAQNFLNDVLFISKGSIRLNGYSYGFIGGCCGKISKNELAFNGRIDSHENANSIIDFLSKHNIEPIELHNDCLYDIGGIIPITEDLPDLA